jgi:hypothetical protein
MVARSKRMTPKQALFVKFYLEGKSGAEAARLAGYRPGTVRNRAFEFLNRNAQTMTAITKGHEEIRREANYDVAKGMQELSDAMVFARQTKNATALARCVELRAKLCGLLDTKEKAPVAAFAININGVDAPQPVAINIVDIDTPSPVVAALEEEDIFG